MRAIHDVGGLEAGPIDQSEHRLSLSGRRIDAMMQLLFDPGRKIFNIDEIAAKLAEVRARLARVLFWYRNAEQHAFGKDGLPEPPVYHVQFEQERIWPAYQGPARDALVDDVYAAAAELGIDTAGPKIVVLENTPEVHHVVFEPRGVLAEFGTELAPEVEVGVIDNTAECRYLVLPLRPSAP